MNKGMAPAHWRDSHEDIIDDDDNEDDAGHFNRKDEAADHDNYHDQMMWS